MYEINCIWMHHRRALLCGLWMPLCTVISKIPVKYVCCTFSIKFVTFQGIYHIHDWYSLRTSKYYYHSKNCSPLDASVGLVGIPWIVEVFDSTQRSVFNLVCLHLSFILELYLILPTLLILLLFHIWLLGSALVFVALVGSAYSESVLDSVVFHVLSIRVRVWEDLRWWAVIYSNVLVCGCEKGSRHCHTLFDLVSVTNFFSYRFDAFSSRASLDDNVWAILRWHGNWWQW